MVASLEALSGMMEIAGAERIYAKRLAANDNSKNQIYLGGDFSALNIIPHGPVRVDDSELAGSRRDRGKADVKFFWLDEMGLHGAQSAQLILYPRYPEVRMSGLLKGCEAAPSDILRVRDEGRILFLGIARNGWILGYATSGESALAKEFDALENLKTVGVFFELPKAKGTNSRNQLIGALTRICRKQWISSKKLGRDGVEYPYSARNGGGYTLEAELGISPNGISEPDYLGWEIKQYSVRDFARFAPKAPITLLTPEPTGGFYREAGIEKFMNRYGYDDKAGRAGRVNFGGVYSCIKAAHPTTGLRLFLSGYDSQTGKITDLEGGLILAGNGDQIAASWKFTNIIEHWSRKHARAAYMPSLFRYPPPEYKFGQKVSLYEGADLSTFLNAVSIGAIYLDPALKMTKAANGGLDWKKRNQFRVKHADLSKIYQRQEVVELDIAE